MLKLHFINVGDGDSILVEALDGPKPFRMLVDTGRDDVDATEGSLRLSASDYLHSLGIQSLDALVITHLHVDHFGGTRDLIGHAQIPSVYSGFFPDPASVPASCDAGAAKSERGLVECLNRWMQDVSFLRQQGAELHTVDEAVSIPTNGKLSVRVIPPKPNILALQYAVFGLLCAGKPGGPLMYPASKSRNPGSLRVELQYAGRVIELSGDCFGAEWEEIASHADLWKVPHHGDGRSVTDGVVRKVCPEIAVISCDKDYIARKDRPSNQVCDWLEAVGAKVYFTDAFSLRGAPPSRHRAVIAAIEADGTITIED